MIFDKSIIQFPCPLIKVIMEILFAVLIISLLLPKYKCCMNKISLSKVSIKYSGNVTCFLELLSLLLTLNKLLETNNFNSFVTSLLIILFVVLTRQAFSQNNLFISSIKEFLFHCYLDAIR